MALFLQILGILFLVLVLVVVGGFFLLRSKFRKAMSELVAQAEEMKYGITPTRIHLRRRDAVAWQNPEAAESYSSALLALGFEDAGSYDIEELDFVRLRGFAHPGESVYAAVYEHEKAGTWFDLVSFYQDGTSATYSNAPRLAQGMDQRPGHSKTFDNGADLQTLFQRMLAERPGGALSPATTSGFANALERAYADHMDWRHARGPSEDEIRFVAAEMGEEPSDEQLAEVREQLELQSLAGLDESLRERFLEQSSLSAAEWEAVRERVVIVHDRLKPEMLAERYTEWVNMCGEYAEEEDEREEQDDPEYQKALAAARVSEPRAAFAALNEQLPEEKRFRLLGTVTYPLPAAVYVAPEG
ncbi:MAG: hypothetical protein ACK47B_08150 [Armatimonadota bacterium]